jgi:hypothetical protein
MLKLLEVWLEAAFPVWALRRHRAALAWQREQQERAWDEPLPRRHRTACRARHWLEPSPRNLKDLLKEGTYRGRPSSHR